MIYIAFYKAKGNFLDRMIRWWTDSIYSHCEFTFSDTVSFAAETSPWGTHFKRETYSEGDWDMFQLDISKEEEHKIRMFCGDENNCGYDIIGIIFTQILPFSFENPWWWFCSEVVTAGLQQIGEFTDMKAHQVSPGTLAFLLSGTKIVKLPGEYKIL